MIGSEIPWGLLMGGSMLSDADIKGTIDRIFSILESAGDAPYIGEPVSQLQHSLQAAALAARALQPDVVFLASLFHDIGHLADPTAAQMAEVGTLDHERLGANYLSQLGFSADLCHLVRGHVLGKRYLCFKKANYLNSLSNASRETLRWQGGPMGPEEAAAFESDPWFETILRLRTFDDRAKDPRAEPPPLHAYRAMCEMHLAAQHPNGETPC